MADRIAELIILAEDLRQANFVRRYLERAGHSIRNIRVRPTSSGRGAGEQYVRERYPIEVAYYRNRSHRRNAALVAMIDADTGEVADRERELESALRGEGQAQRTQGEAIALLIPKRNVETWILCLVGNAVDEVTDYSHDKRITDSIKPAAETLFRWSRPNYTVPVNCVPSLRKGLVEIWRVN